MALYRCLIIAITVGALSQPAFGQRFDYVSAYSGWVFLNDYRDEFNGDDQIGSFKEGWLLGGALGKYLSSNYRFEAEFFYRNNRSDQWESPLGTTVDWDGRLNSFSSMGNLIRDCGTWGYLTPYFGGGMGAAYLDGEFETATTEFTIDDTVFAYQGIAGIKTQLTSRVHLLTEYRYFGTSKARLTNENLGQDAGTFAYDSHNALIGLSICR